ncbi:hypothetical protein BHE74_00042918 [Ensete ventricosum]|nr:hypothetical protein BHE74_00042918 [Ensete ventricosum]
MLATKLDGAQGKAGRLVKDETVHSGRCCVMTERVVQSSQSTLLDLKGTVGTVLAKGHDLASAFAGAEQGTSCSARRSSPKGMVVSETSSGKYVKRKVAPIGQVSRRDKS